MGLHRLAANASAEPRPWARALKGTVWLLVPPVIWLLIAVVAGLRPVGMASGFGLLALPALLVMVRSFEPLPLTRRIRMVITISILAIGLWLLVMPLALSPALAGMLDRLALLALAALAWIIMATAPLDGLERAVSRFRLPLIPRLPPAVASHAVRLLGMSVIVIAMIGIVGYAPLAGYLLTRLVGVITVLAAVILALAAIERLSLGAGFVLRRRNRETSAFWRRGVVGRSRRILTIIVLLAGLQAFAALFD